MESGQAETMQGRHIDLLGNLIDEAVNILGAVILPFEARVNCVDRLLPIIRDMVKNAILENSDYENVADLERKFKILVEIMADISDGVPFCGEE